MIKVTTCFKLADGGYETEIKCCHMPRLTQFVSLQYPYNTTEGIIGLPVSHLPKEQCQVKSYSAVDGTLKENE